MSLDPDSTYYDAGGIETIDIIKAKMTPEQFQGFCLGNAMKYCARMAFKHSSYGRDIEKAINYLKLLKGVVPAVVDEDALTDKEALAEAAEMYEWCGAYAKSEGISWTCSRPKGHGGEHIACDPDSVCHRWDSEV